MGGRQLLRGRNLRWMPLSWRVLSWHLPGLFRSISIDGDVQKKRGVFGYSIVQGQLGFVGVFGIGSYIFEFYWLFLLHWDEHPIVVLMLLVLLIIHMPLSLFILCPKCSYNETCTMANVYKVFKMGSGHRQG
jgi:hypothetical protein